MLLFFFIWQVLQLSPFVFLTSYFSVQLFLAVWQFLQALLNTSCAVYFTLTCGLWQVMQLMALLDK